MPPAATGVVKTAAGGSSVRARTKQEQDGQRKTVFRPVLDNPLSVTWPPLPASARKAILEALISLLVTPTQPGEQTIAEWRLDEHAARRGRTCGAGKGKGKAAGGEDGWPAGKREMDESGQPTAKRVKTDKGAKDKPSGSISPGMPLATHSITTRTSTYTIPTRTGDRPLPNPARTPAAPPRLLDCLAIGINEVTRALETRVRWGRWELGDAAAAPGGAALADSPSSSCNLIPTASGPAPPIQPPPTTLALPASGGRTRHRKKANPSSFAPSSAARAQPIDYASLPGYSFLSQAAHSPASNLPPYLLPSTSLQPSPRLLVNSESRRIKRLVKAPNLTEQTRKTAADGSRIIKKSRVKAKYFDGYNQTLHRCDLVEGAFWNPDGSITVTDDVPQPTNTGTEPVPEAEPEGVPLIDLIFVCKPDINPPTLVAHLPGMVAAANGVQTVLDSVVAASRAEGEDVEAEERVGEGAMEVDSKEGEQEKPKQERPEMRKVLIVPLDVGAERQLADALALRRVAAIGLSSSAPGAAPLFSLVQEHLQPLSAPWLIPHLIHRPPSASATSLVPTHVKHLRTTAPLNPKAANQAKKAAKKARKELQKDGVYVAED
ncbi:hypothetical protein JCM21900_001078 [Sporobolomyces salmonicolor]